MGIKEGEGRGGREEDASIDRYNLEIFSFFLVILHQIIMHRERGNRCRCVIGIGIGIGIG